MASASQLRNRINRQGNDVRRILVTGASGDVGRKTLLHLLKTRPASDLVALVRDSSKAEDLAALGVELRQGDYFDRASLLHAFAGVEKLMMTSTHAFTDRKTAQGNVIRAAVDAGVEHLVSMSIARKKNSTFSMKEITEEDLFTEQMLMSSGLTYTLAYHPPFLDVLAFYIGANACETGVRVPAGSGKFAAATRDDLAAAHAAILSGDGHENKSYTLTGDPSVSFSDIAEILSNIHGKEVPHTTLSDEAYFELKRADGVPDFVVEFACKWVQGMNAGEWEDQTGDLEALIGRRAKTAPEFFRDDFPLSAKR
jgi:NAD(P)H dehydrogenase (quinone)